MQRRDFLTSSCNACMLLATGLLLPALTGCSPSFQVLHTDIKGDRVEVPADAFAKSSLVLVRPTGWYYSIALRKKEDNTYTALLMKCTHQDNQLTASGDGFGCSLHGSAFNRNGQVTKGPAERALQSYPVTTENNNIIIQTRA